MKRLTPDQARRILAEEYLDHDAFCGRMTIRDKQGIEVPLVLTPAQKKLAEVANEIRAKSQPVRLVVLKARRVHMSVGVASLVFKEIAFVPGQQGSVYAHLESAAEEVFDYYHQFQRSYKSSGQMGIKPMPLKRFNRGEILEWHGGGALKVQTAGSPQASRSKSNRYLHLSEYAFYPDAGTLMTAAMASVPDDQGTMVFVESTANGMGGPFYSLWNQAVEGRGLWKAMFFAWWEHPEYSLPVVDPYHFERSLDDDEWALRRQYGLGLDQLAWRRYAIRDKCEGHIERFHQEYPSNPEEAFVQSGRPRFHLVSLSRMPVDREPIIGDLEAVDVGTRTQPQFVPKPGGLIRLFRRPVQGHVYAIGADTAEGIDPSLESLGSSDPDYSVGTVLDLDTREQCAVLRGRLNPSYFAELLYWLGRWYFWAYMVPERQNQGIATIEHLIKLEYPLELIHQRRRGAGDYKGSPLLQELGYSTDKVGKPQLVSLLDQAIRNHDVLILDAVTMQECQAFVYKPNGKVEAQEGCHDDCVIGLALAVVGLVYAPRKRTLDQERALVEPKVINLRQSRNIYARAR